MTELRWPDGRGRFVDRNTDRTPVDGVLTVLPGETISVDDSDVAAQYLGRGFEAVDADGADGSVDDEHAVESDAEPATDADQGDFDVEAFVDRTPVEVVIDDIDAGKADGHLDAVAEADGRVTVQKAVEDRRDVIGDD
jgi:hypothetical protein